MKKIIVLLAIAASLSAISVARSKNSNHAFSVNAQSISGAPTGEVFLAGGGNFDPESGRVSGGGSFHCNQDINQGPLAGCKAGEGARWEISQFLPSNGFKCSGAAGEPLKTVVSDDDTVVFVANFFRRGDGATASLTARVFVSARDEDEGQPGIQNVWIQGVGCSEAIVNLQ